MAIAFGKIANALQSAASDHILGISQDIYDTTLNAYQSDLNLKVKQLYTTVNDEYPLLLTPPGQTADSNTNTYFSTNVTINPNLGKITALRFARPGGKSTEFLKADGSLDTNTYVTTTTLGNYLPLSGGTLTGALTIKKSSYEIITLERTDSANSVLISFKNTNGLLGWLGMYGSANQGIIRFTADLNTSYTVLDSGNYNSYTPILNSTSTHATKSSVIYAPTTAGTSGQYLTSNGSGAPTWTSLTTLKNPYSLKLKNTEGTVVTYDGSEAKDLSGGVYQSTISNYLKRVNVSHGSTLGDAKTRLLTESAKSEENCGHFITILSEVIDKWNQPDDYIYTTQGGIGSLFKIGGGYANSSYSTWIGSQIVAAYRLGVVRQVNGVWQQMRYLAWTSDIPTKVSQLTNDRGYLTTQSLANYVTLDGEQTITGNKLFTEGIKLLKYLSSEHWDALTLEYRGGWSNYRNYLAGITITDGNGKVGSFGITYGNTYGEFVIRDLYKSTYGDSGKVFSVNAIGTVTSNKFVITGGTSSQFLKADGTLDNNTYVLSTTLSNYVTLDGTGATGTWNININGSAATLTTPRTIWGQSFNGSANIDGDITILAGDTDKSIKFLSGTNSTYNWRIAYIGTGTGDTNYLSFESTKATTSTWEPALQLACSTLNATFAGQVTAPNFIQNSNGTSDFTSGTLKIKALNVLTTATGSTYGAGTSGQILRSNGTNVYWSNLDKLTTTTLKTNQSYSLKNDTWTDTGYSISGLDTGTYMIQVTSTNLVASGVFSVQKSLTDTAGDEIPLHVYGLAGWRPYLRTNGTKLEISANNSSAVSRTVTIKIVQII